MTQEEKQLLLIDLCARLPYGVKLLCANREVVTLVNPPITIQDDCWNFKPYLRPMSSMTEEEKYEINEFLGYRKEINVLGDIHCAGWNGDVFVDIDKVYGYLNWLNAHHFDYRGLIKKGLALEAKEGMYKTE